MWANRRTNRTGRRRSARSVQNGLESVEIDLECVRRARISIRRTRRRGIALESRDIGLRRVLAERTQQVTQVLPPDRARAGLVEEREGLLDV